MWAVTLTGAPKKMAVQIIENMEATPRRWYGAAVGGLLLNGGVNTGITIRTVHIEDGRASYRVGATLLWDSEGLEEARETRTKATPFFRALAAETASAAGAERAAAQFGEGVTIVMIDNEDSFVHTLADYFRQHGAVVRTYRSGVPIERIVAERPGLVVHSPGPGRPENAGVAIDVVRRFGPQRPILGVCLGHQALACAFGATVSRAPRLLHGKTSAVYHDGKGVFQGITNPLVATNPLAISTIISTRGNQPWQIPSIYA